MKFVLPALTLFVVSCSKEQAPAPRTPTTNPAVVAPTNSSIGSAHSIQFPRDEGWHSDYPLEWWYLNSQFTNAAGKKYAFFLCKFSTGRHLVSLFDNAADKTWVKDYYEQVNAASDKLELSSITGQWKQTEPFHYSFLYDFEGVHLELTMKANKAPFLPGGEGFVAMGEKGTSSYYALTDLTITGTVKTGTNEPQMEVSGQAWVDHQWGKWDWVKDFTQWKWYSIKLDNGVDLMLFNIYKNKKLLQSHCGYIDADNKQYHKLPCELVTRQYFTDANLGKWQKEVDLVLSNPPNTKLTLVSDKDDQFIERFVLWEGTMKVSGTFNGKPVKGTAYQELNRPD